MSTYQHVEAFALMAYVSDDGTVSTRVWNSRDGVTPFMIPGGPGLVLKHVDWRGDRYEPHWPHVGLAVGHQVFVDIGKKRARRGGHPTDPRLVEVDHALLSKLRRHFPIPPVPRTTLGSGRFA